MAEQAGKKKQKSLGIFGVMPVVLAMGLIGPIFFVGAFWILLNTGPWCVPLFLAYVALCITPTAYFMSLRARQEDHFHMGHELFYKEYPGALKKALWKARKKGIPEATLRTLEAYAAQPKKEAPPEAPEAARKRRLGLFLFILSGVLLSLLAIFFFLRARTLANTIALAARRARDYTPLMLYGAAGGVLTAALLCFFRKKLRSWFVTVLLILLFSSWSIYISYTVNRTLALKDVLLNLGGAVLYALIAFGLTAPARDLRSPAEKQRDYRQQQLDFFELGIISEEDLVLRLNK